MKNNYSSDCSNCILKNCGEFQRLGSPKGLLTNRKVIKRNISSSLISHTVDSKYDLPCSFYCTLNSERHINTERRGK